MFKNKPYAGAGGAHFTLFLDLKTFIKSFSDHFSVAKYFKHPTIDLTWFWRKDLDLNSIEILSPFFFTITELIFLTGDLAEQDDDLKVEKSCVPSKIFAPVFNNLIFNFFLTCQAFFRFKDNKPCLLIIWYS